MNLIPIYTTCQYHVRQKASNATMYVYVMKSDVMTSVIVVTAVTKDIVVNICLNDNFVIITTTVLN